jgi:thiamine pyrophosphate-dependent acetolactate synthase large subunit-like protein
MKKLIHVDAYRQPDVEAGKKAAYEIYKRSRRPVQMNGKGCRRKYSGIPQLAHKIEIDALSTVYALALATHRQVP